ncbi:MAG: phospholipid carrier-dependent glycosyltransferase [Ilumatobacteraceae bacterium]
MSLAIRLRAFLRTREGRAFAIVVVAGLVLRLGWGLWSMREVPSSLSDQFSYWYYGNEMAHFRGYISYNVIAGGNSIAVQSTGMATSYYPLGWPALLGVVYWLGLHTCVPDDQAKLTAVTQALLSTGSVALVYFVARKSFNHRIGIIAGVIVALFPSLIASVGTYSIETPFIFFMLVSIAIVVDHDWASGPMSTGRLVWFGIALGWSAMVRPFSLPIVLGLIVAVWCGGRDRSPDWKQNWRRSWKQLARHLGWTVLVLGVVLTPWTIRNAVTFHKLIPFSNNLGDTMCLSRFIGSDGGFAWSDHAGCADPSLPEAVRNPANTKAAIQFVLDHPREELRQIPLRLRLMMNNDHSVFGEVELNGSHVTFGADARSALYLSADWYFRAVWLLALGGVGLLFRGWRRDPLQGPRRALIAIPALCLLLIPIGLWGTPRFHIPLLPYLAIAAAASLSWMIDRWRSATAPRVFDPADRVCSFD